MYLAHHPLEVTSFRHDKSYWLIEETVPSVIGALICYKKQNDETTRLESWTTLLRNPFSFVLSLTAHPLLTHTDPPDPRLTHLPAGVREADAPLQVPGEDVRGGDEEGPGVHQGVWAAQPRQTRQDDRPVDLWVFSIYHLVLLPLARV